MRRALQSLALALAVTATMAAVLAPIFFTDYGIHNDYTIGTLVGTVGAFGFAGDPNQPFGHIESFHLVRVGRILNALLYNVHWRWIEFYTDLRASRAVSASLLVFSGVLLAVHWRRLPGLSAAAAALLAVAILTTPALTIDAFYAQLLVPGAGVIVLMVLLFLAQRRLLEAALTPRIAPGRLAAWAVFTASGLVAGHFVYSPSTAFFLSLSCVELLHGAHSADRRRAALLELGTYAFACPLYFALQKLVVFPWAARAFVYGDPWTDAAYRFGVSRTFGEPQLAFAREAVATTLDPWNAFRAMNLAWLTVAIVVAALVVRGMHADRNARHRGAWIACYFLACFAMFLAPPLVAGFSAAPGYRMLAGPMSLAATALLWAVFELLRSSPRNGLYGANAWILPGVWLLVSVAAGATIWTGVRWARADVVCLESLMWKIPPHADLILLETAAGRTPLRHEFGWTPSERGLTQQFAAAVVSDLGRRHLIGAQRASALRNGVLAIDAETARTLETRGTAIDPVTSRTVRKRGALLRLSPCSCVTGWDCGDAQQLPLGKVE